MITFEDAIKLELSEDEIKNIIQFVIEKNEISKLDNLRFRHKNVQFDCLLRGYIGEYCILKWLKSHDIEVEKTNYLENEDQIDIDFLYKGLNIELKTSLIPDTDKTLQNTINKRDIKLIKRGNSTIEALKGDLHLQIFYKQKRKAKDGWLESQQIDLNNHELDYLYQMFCARAYLNTTYLVAWIDKSTLIKKINAMPENLKYWSFLKSKRHFWNCKIKDSRKPQELISYLKNK